MCAIIVFDVCFELYTELLFGNVGLNGSLNTTIKRANTLDGNEALGTTCYGKPFFNLSG